MNLPRVSLSNGEAARRLVGATRIRFDVALVKQPRMREWSQVIGMKQVRETA